MKELEKVPPLELDPSELSEVLINMIINAIDALPCGGKIILRSWEKDGSVYISVEDTGVGISEEDKRRVFDPFFTTKGVKGVGLGLSVAYGIITRYGGEISVESQLNQGSTFVTKLPLHKRQSLDLQPGKSLPEAERPEGLSSGEKQKIQVPICHVDLCQPRQERG
jgi:signal transduction histidine kinase